MIRECLSKPFLPSIPAGDDQVSEPDARGVKAQLDTHEAVCALRYAGINARLKRLETILITVSGAIILLLVKLVVQVP